MYVHIPNRHKDFWKFADFIESRISDYSVVVITADFNNGLLTEPVFSLSMEKVGWN